MDHHSDADSESLADDNDGDMVSAKLAGGTLSFSSPPSAELSHPSDMTTTHTTDSPDSTASVGTPTKGSPQGRFTQNKVVFKVLSARTVKSEKDKHVAYSIAIRTAPGLDHAPPVVIERRYTDFHTLHESLRRHFPQEMGKVKFPRKAVIGNFSPVKIGERSLAFEHYLYHVAACKLTRQCDDFLGFLTRAEMAAAVRLLVAASYEASIQVLTKCVHVLERVCAGGRLHQTVPGLCAMAVCYDELEQPARASELAELALTRVSGDDPLYAPLLELAAHLRWSLGKEKQDLERKLSEMKESGGGSDASSCRTHLSDYIKHMFTS